MSCSQFFPQNAFSQDERNLDLILISNGSGSIFCGSAWVRSAIYGWFGLGKFPPKFQIFPFFFPSDQKNFLGSGQKVLGSKPGWSIIFCGSKVSSGQVRAHF